MIEAGIIAISLIVLVYVIVILMGIVGGRPL
jgi:hypothetical protein